MTPSVYASQQIGLFITTALSNHLLEAYKGVRTRPAGDDHVPIGSLLLEDAIYLDADIDGQIR